MAPLPKKKCSHSRQGERRSHMALRKPPVTECPQCRSPRLNHHACSVCGYYNGREAVTIEAPKKKTP